MRFFSKKISSFEAPEENEIKNKYLLLVEDGCCAWCGSLVEGRFDSKSVSINGIRKLGFFKSTFNGSLSFPLSQEVYIVDSVGYDFFCKIQNKRDFLVFMDNLN